MNLFKKCIAEFLGAFLIVFGGCGAVIADQASGGAVSHVGIATSFGLIVMVMIYATGHICGAHFNPAVTIAFSVTRHFPVKQIGPYIISQCLGAILASALHVMLFSGLVSDEALNLGVTQPKDDTFLLAASLEFVLTFFLMFVIMAVATDYRAVGNMAGLAIGGTVWLEAMFAGPLCGASMNPARSLGPALAAGEWNHFAAYVIGPILGAVTGAVVYKFIRCDEPDKDEQVQGCC